MPNNFDAILVAERDVYFDDYGETIQVRANRDATARDITAIIERHEPPTLPAGGVLGIRSTTRITIKNHATEGVLASSLDVGTYQFKVSAKQGGTADWSGVAKVESQDAGTIRLELR